MYAVLVLAIHSTSADSDSAFSSDYIAPNIWCVTSDAGAIRGRCLALGLGDHTTQL